MEYTIYNADGRITNIVGCEPGEIDAAVTAAGGAGYLEGVFPWAQYRVSAGQAVPFSVKPGPRFAWNWSTQEWAESRTLVQAKIAKNAEINAARAAANASYFSFGGKQIAADDLSIKDILATNGDIQNYGAFAPGWPGAWKAIDNSYVAISDVATWRAFFRAMVAQGTVNFAYSQQLKAALAAATTLAEVDAITWAPT